MENSIVETVDWLKKTASEAKVNGLLVGISGGLDSAVVAYLIKKAFPNHSIGVMMPLKSNPKDMEHAELVINGAGLNSLTIDLTETHDLMYSQIIHKIDEKDEIVPKTKQLADANLRARLRMSTLYTVATNYNYLVVGTDNASEWYTGYFTKYGDGGVDIQPIISFTKEEVREMARILGVPNEIIEKKPSADLWEGQTDEEEMGTTYTAIDAYLVGDKVSSADKEIIESMHRKTAHKRAVPKPFIYGDRNFPN